jgi:hypothetical protein
MFASRTSRRQFLASAVPAVAIAGASGVIASQALPASLARLVEEFDTALAGVEAATARLEAPRDENDFDLDEALHDAFGEAWGRYLQTGEALVTAVRKRTPGAMALATSTAVYAFEKQDGILFTEVRRLPLGRIARA